MKRKDKKKSVIRRIFDILGYSIFSFIVVLFLIVFVQSVSGSTPHLFGYYIYHIQTDSMKGDNPDSFSSGTVIISTMVDSEEKLSELKVGDIVTFIPTDDNLPEYVVTKTHRITKIEEDTITTKGDANNAEDKPIPLKNVISKMVKISPVLTFFYGIISSFWGFFIFIFIPLLILIVLEVYHMVISRKLEKDKSKNESQVAFDLEAEKRRLEEEAIREYIESQKKKEKEND